IFSWRPTSSLTCRSISAGSAEESTRGRINAGFFAASAGKSHSCVTPTTESPRPNAKRISVADGSSEQIRISACYLFQLNRQTCDQMLRLRRGRRSGSWKNIRKDEAFPLNNFTRGDGNAVAEHGPGVGKRMKFAILTARVHIRGKRFQQFRVEPPPRKRAV